MQDRSQPSRFLPRLLLVAATLAAGTCIWFLLGEPESVIAEEGRIDGALALVAGEPITEEEILALAAEDLRRLERRRRELIRHAVDAQIRTRLVDVAARAAGASREEFLVAELGPAPTRAPDPRYEAAYRALIERLAKRLGVEYRIEVAAVEPEAKVVSAPGL